jgi:hypothetical protein
VIFHGKKELRKELGKLSEDRKRVGFLQRGGKEDGNGAKKKQQVSKLELLNSIIVLPVFSPIAL